jgi:hypothetical protein
MRCLVTAAAVLLSVLCDIAHAADSSPITDRFALRAIFVDASVSSELRLDSGTGASATAGTLISAEDVLGLASKRPQGRMELMFRVRERNRVRFDYMSLDRSGNVPLDRTIVFGDNIFFLNEVVASDFNWRMMRFTYTYSFIRNDRFEIGFGLGADIIQAQVTGRVPARLTGEEASGVAALPTIALDSTWAISKRWAFNLRGQYFGTTVGNVGGSLAHYHSDIQYRLRKNLQLGLGYTIDRIKLESNDRDFPGRFALNTRGPEMFVRASF